MGRTGPASSSSASTSTWRSSSDCEGGSFHASFLWIEGTDPSERVGNLNAISSLSAPAAARVYQLWYKHTLAPVTVKLGQVVASDDFMVSSSRRPLPQRRLRHLPHLHGEHQCAHVPSGRPRRRRDVAGDGVRLAPVWRVRRRRGTQRRRQPRLRLEHGPRVGRLLPRSSTRRASGGGRESTSLAATTTRLASPIS